MFKKLESGVIINVNLIEVIEKDYEGQQRAKINKGSYIVTEKDIEEIARLSDGVGSFIAIMPDKERGRE